MNRFLYAPPVILLLAACGCATTGKQVQASESEVRDMMASVVQINVQIAITAIVAGEEIPVDPVGWSGSGVVYDRTGGLISPPHSMVLTANHVLEVPAIGQEVDFPLGKIRVDAILITVTHDNRTCELETRALGVNDYRDVAIGEAQCDIADPAPIAKRVPPKGARIVIVGHPLGFPSIIVTEGILSGWWNNYLVASAPIAPGNSGGPVFYNGEIVGLAVRGAPRYPNLSIIAPLGQILERIEEL